MKKVIFILLSLCLVGEVSAQNADNYERIVRELGSARFQGRGYAKDGVKKASRFLANEFRKAGADDVGIQPFSIDINTFPGKMKMSVDGRRLKPGDDFSMREFSPGVRGKYKLYFIDTLSYDSDRIFSDLSRKENENVFVVCDFWFTYKHGKDFKRLQSDTSVANAGLILTWDAPLKFYKAYGEKVSAKPVVWVMSDLVKGASNVEFDIENKFLPAYQTSNVIAKVDGERHDSCYVFVAHYDHLGNLGRRTWFPGVNDNASGTAALVAIAEHYAKNRPQFDIVCIAVSGEEANLRGSTYYVEHPTISLDRIKYLFDLDMIGDDNPVQYCEVSEPGNAGFAKMQCINAEKGYFRELRRGELAANSDHWPFALKGVPCILFENESGSNFPYYHTMHDDWSRVELGTYPKIFGLVTDYISGK